LAHETFCKKRASAAESWMRGTIVPFMTIFRQYSPLAHASRVGLIAILTQHLVQTAVAHNHVQEATILDTASHALTALKQSLDNRLSDAVGGGSSFLQRTQKSQAVLGKLEEPGGSPTGAGGGVAPGAQDTLNVNSSAGLDAQRDLTDAPPADGGVADEALPADGGGSGGTQQVLPVPGAQDTLNVSSAADADAPGLPGSQVVADDARGSVGDSGEQDTPVVGPVNGADDQEGLRDAKAQADSLTSAPGAESESDVGLRSPPPQAPETAEEADTQGGESDAVRNGADNDDNAVVGSDGVRDLPVAPASEEEAALATRGSGGDVAPAQVDGGRGDGGVLQGEAEQPGEGGGGGSSNGVEDLLRQRTREAIQQRDEEQQAAEAAEEQRRREQEAAEQQQQRHEAASTIQAQVRRRLAEQAAEEQRRQAAATTIQRVYRGHSTRQDLAKQDRLRREAEDEERRRAEEEQRMAEAATTIQSRVRGNIARRRLAEEAAAREATVSGRSRSAGRAVMDEAKAIKIASNDTGGQDHYQFYNGVSADFKNQILAVRDFAKSEGLGELAKTSDKAIKSSKDTFNSYLHYVANLERLIGATWTYNDKLESIHDDAINKIQSPIVEGDFPPDASKRAIQIMLPLASELYFEWECAVLQKNSEKLLIHDFVPKLQKKIVSYIPQQNVEQRPKRFLICVKARTKKLPSDWEGSDRCENDRDHFLQKRDQMTGGAFLNFLLEQREQTLLKFLIEHVHRESLNAEIYFGVPHERKIDDITRDEGGAVVLNVLDGTDESQAFNEQEDACERIKVAGEEDDNEKLQLKDERRCLASIRQTQCDPEMFKNYEDGPPSQQQLREDPERIALLNEMKQSPPDIVTELAATPPDQPPSGTPTDEQLDDFNSG